MLSRCFPRHFGSPSDTYTHKIDVSLEVFEIFSYKNKQITKLLKFLRIVETISTLHRDLNNSVAFIFKQFICLVDLRERIGMRNQRLGIELALGN